MKMSDWQIVISVRLDIVFRKMRTQTLNINEIFKSIQGESSFAGLPCVFVRLAGCNLRCRYCDTKYAYKTREVLTVAAIVKKVRVFKISLVEITGGEPLLQQSTPLLAKKLVDEGYRVLCETNGTMDISTLPVEVIRIMDIKCPKSGCEKQTDWDNIKRLRLSDEVKFVISSRKDYEWAKSVIAKYKLTARARVCVGAVEGTIKPTRLAQWILDDNLDLRLNMQLHKILWPHKKRGV